MNKKRILMALAVLVISAGITFWLAKKENSQPAFYSLWIGDTKLKVEIADSQGERGQGLGGRESLPQDQGMFFIFERPGKYPFWMRDMRFPLDIIWLDEYYNVADMAMDVKPDSYPSAFAPNKNALYVLEVNAGWTAANKVEIGSKAVLKR